MLKLSIPSSEFVRSDLQTNADVVELFEEHGGGRLSSVVRNRLIEKHRESAQKMARSLLRGWKAHLELEELQSLTDTALCEAAYNFRPAKQARFTTFLYYYIRGRLIRAMSKRQKAQKVRLVDVAELTSDELITSEEERPEAQAEVKDLLSRSRKALSGLEDIERQIVEQVYLKEIPLTAVAKSLGYSRSHISRLRNGALGKLRLALSA